MSKARLDVIHSIPPASPVPVPLLNANLSSTNTRTSSIFLSNILLSILPTIFAVCTMVLIACWSLHFVGFGFYFKAITVTSVHSLGHCPVSPTLLISCVIRLRLFLSQQLRTTTRILLIPHRLYSFFHFTLQNWAILVCTYFFPRGSF